MKTVCLFILSFALLESTLAQFGGGYYGGGFFGGGYGCPSYLPTNGFQCYQPKQDNTVWCKGKMQLITKVQNHIYIFTSDIYLRLHCIIFKGRVHPPIKTLGTLEITGHFWLLMGNYHLAILAFITPI